eukprot:2208637-Amphidinium_carterae.1
MDCKARSMHAHARTAGTCKDSSDNIVTRNMKEHALSAQRKQYNLAANLRTDRLGNRNSCGTRHAWIIHST